MDTAWRVVDCSALKGRLRSERGAIVVCPDDGGEYAVPVADVAVVLMGVNVGFSTAVMHRLLGADVVVMFCDWRGVPEGAVYPWRDHTRVGARQLAQANLSVPRRKNAWGRIVKAKISGQARVVGLRDRWAAERLRGIAKEVRSGDPDNAEGHAARIYWSRVFPPAEDFCREQDLVDGRNSCLNYGYGVLRAHGVRAVVSAGLNPTIGLFHRGRSNVFNLVDDIIEPFRPAVDDAVVRLSAEASPDDRAIKRILVSAVEQPFNSKGHTLPTVLEQFAQHLGQYVEGSLDRLTVPQWNGPREDALNGR
ncbi:MAG: type II CRISPR-associated endonuclease Cas1 [Actinomycetaceae bacterium]|nr:type II CRISPR-associated endonuclease Cas1 [Actinomycetaceae bacterium]